MKLFGLQYQTELDPLAGKRVVLIDDDWRVAAFAERLLQSVGMQVVAKASSGEAGVAAAECVWPDIVLINAGVGEAEGLEAARSVLNVCRACVVLMTDRRPLADRLPDGLAGVLVKPLRGVVANGELRSIYEKWCQRGQTLASAAEWWPNVA